jgi:hypothetical protein
VSEAEEEECKTGGGEPPKGGSAKPPSEVVGDLSERTRPLRVQGDVLWVKPWSGAKSSGYVEPVDEALSEPGRRLVERSLMEWCLVEWSLMEWIHAGLLEWMATARSPSPPGGRTSGV